MRTLKYVGFCILAGFMAIIIVMTERPEADLVDVWPVYLGFLILNALSKQTCCCKECK